MFVINYTTISSDPKAAAYWKIILFMIFTALISNCAGSLAGRLAGSLAFTATALLHSILQSLRI